MQDSPKKIEIINGNGNDLEISEVHEHLRIARPKTKDEKAKKIIVPEEKKK